LLGQARAIKAGETPDRGVSAKDARAMAWQLSLYNDVLGGAAV
jgi:hypothetical protein